MPNAVGPEAMRDWLHLHGIKRPADLDESMRVIEQYVSFCMRVRHPELFEEPSPLVKIAPNAKQRTWRGDPDIKIRCSSCREIKVARGNYYRRPDTATGWGRKCNACQRPHASTETMANAPRRNVRLMRPWAGWNDPAVSYATAGT